MPLPQPKPDRSEGGRAVRNAERVREAIRTAYPTAPDLAEISGTPWDALQAVTGYVDHTQPTRQGARERSARLVAEPPSRALDAAGHDRRLRPLDRAERKRQAGLLVGAFGV